MTPEEVLGAVAAKLEQNGIAYMIAGSFASNLHGMPRTTHDADIVVEIDEPRLQKFSHALAGEFYFDLDAARDALARNSMFSTIHYDSGFKVDFIVLKQRPFSRTEFQRRTTANYLGRRCWFATAEDTILAKLEWSKLSESERQFNDAVGTAKVQGKALDIDYLRRWSKDLQTDDLLHRLLQEIGAAP